jgi:hypothetical protein
MTPTRHHSPEVTFILLSFARPRNLARIVESILRAESRGRIIVCNNQPAIDIRDYLDSGDDRLEIIQTDAVWGPIKRYHIARERPGPFYVSIDDDIFLTPSQIDQLVNALIADPSRAHGVWGQILQIDSGKFNLTSGVHNKNCAVSNLNCVYAFTKTHVRRYFELLEILGMSNLREIGPGDDIFLSFSGAQEPLCHNFGPIEVCPSYNQAGVARFQSENFTTRRIRLYRRLQALSAPEMDAAVLEKTFTALANGAATSAFRRHLKNLNSIIATELGQSDSTFISEGNLFYHHEITYPQDAAPDESRAYKRNNFIYALRGANTLLEIGFNAGHSALLALTLFPQLVYLGVDNHRHRYTAACVEYLNDVFGRRFRVLNGNSQDILPLLASQNLGIKPDLIHIDGGHDKDICQQDLTNALRLSDDYTRILIDDLNLPDIRNVLNDFVQTKRLRLPPLVKEWAGVDQALAAPPAPVV